MKTFQRILSFSRPNKRVFAMYGLTTLFAVLFNIVGFSFIAPILKVLIDSGDVASVKQVSAPDFSFSIGYVKQGIEYLKYWVLTSGSSNIEVLGNIVIFLIISNFLSNLFTYLSQSIQGIIRARVVKNVREAIYNKSLDLHLGYFQSENKGDVMSRITVDVQEIENTVIGALTVLLRDPLKIFFIVLVLCALSPFLTLLSLIVLPLSGLAIGIITKKLKRKAKQSQDILGRILGTVDETISGLRVIKAFNATRFKKYKFKLINERYAKILRSMTYKRSLASPLSQFLGITVVAAILYFGGQQVFSGKLEGDLFMLFIVFFAQLIEPIKAIASAVSTIQRGIIAGERVFKVIDTEIPIKNKTNASSLKSFEKEIRFSDVRFSYENEPVLKGINLTVEKGKTIALVGPSGGGKSTLIDLIPRFQDPNGGSVSIDGTDLKEYTMESIRQQMGMVTQDAILFNDSIFNNITFGKSASKEDVIQAAKIANAHNFIMETEEGYDTVIGDRGTKLSGGQRQRLTIARAVLKNPAILLLDEATSALDSESEHLVQEALTNLMKNRTSIVIAHRLSTIQHADEIIVLEKGEIVERGTHNALLETGGLYHKLSQMQSTL